MNDIIIYLLKVSLAVGISCLTYALLLRNNSALWLKRVFLVGSIILAWVAPSLQLGLAAPQAEFTPVFLLDSVSPVADASVVSGTATATVPFSPWQIVFIIYLTGFLFFLGRNLFLVLQIRRRISHISADHANIAYTEEKQVFSLLQRIYIPVSLRRNEQLETILIHEQAHIRQMHIIDLIISEISLVLTWFNPFSWLISRMIKENHEFLADRAVLASGVKPGRYKALLLEHAVGVPLFRLGHQLNHSLTKKRFIMMQKIKATKSGLIRLALVVPMIFAAMVVTTASGQQTTGLSGSVFLESTDIPATGAAVIIAGTHEGTVVDRNGEFKLLVGGDPEIVISFVGYATERKTVEEIQAGPVILQPTAYTIRLDEKKKNTSADNESIRNRTEGERAFDGEVVLVVDGKKVKSVDHLEPADIEKIEVIKDRSHRLAKKYDAENGIVLITTRQNTMNPEEELPGDEEFYVVEEIPSFPGGNTALRKYIRENLTYPAEALKNNTGGEVMVKFSVLVSGEVSAPEVIQSADPLLDSAALGVIARMPAWKPGMQRGKRVRTDVIVPVRFDPEQE